MATIQNKSTVQNTQDFITIQDLFYLCLNKWHWFAISLALCLGVRPLSVENPIGICQDCLYFD